MGKIYKSQDSLRIKLTTSVDITGATVKKIYYKKPSGTIGSWDATVDVISTGVIYYDVVSGDIDESGQWKFWAYVTFSDGRSAPGQYVAETIYTIPS